MSTLPAPRRLYAPPTDPDAPLDEIEQALVRALVRVLVQEIREDPTCWIGGNEDEAEMSSPKRRRVRVTP